MGQGQGLEILAPPMEELGPLGPTEFELSAAEPDLPDVVVEAPPSRLAGARCGSVGDLFQIDLFSNEDPLNAESSRVLVAQRFIAAERASIARSDPDETVVKTLNSSTTAEKMPGLMLDLQVTFGIDASMMPRPHARQTILAREGPKQGGGIPASPRKGPSRPATVEIQLGTTPEERAVTTWTQSVFTASRRRTESTKGAKTDLTIHSLSI